MDNFFSKNLKSILNDKKLSALDVSIKTGICRITLISFMAGIREPSLKNLRTLAIYLELKIDELVNDKYER